MKLVQDASILLRDNDVRAFHQWYQRSPKAARFRRALGKHYSERRWTHHFLVVPAPQNNLGIEWVSFQPSLSAIQDAQRYTRQVETQRVPQDSYRESNNEERSWKRDLAIAGAVAAAIVIGKAVKSELLGPSQDIWVESYTREDGTPVRSHYRSRPSN